jgi:hypothetical protein
MSRFISRFGALLLLGAVPLMFACRDDVTGPRNLDEPEPAGLHLAVVPGLVTIQVGQTVQLTAILKDSQGTPLGGYSAMLWSSSNPGIASVSDRGAIRALAEGSVTITVGCGEYCAYATVTVIPAQDNRPPHGG